MAWSNHRIDAVLELVVMMLQVFGVAMLCLHRLLPATRWAEKGRVGFILAMIGLGIAGAWVGCHDSEFALFAGGTMTFLLIGMIAGNSTTDANLPVAVRLGAEPSLAR